MALCCYTMLSCLNTHIHVPVEHMLQELRGGTYKAVLDVASENEIASSSAMEFDLATHCSNVSISIPTLSASSTTPMLYKLNTILLYTKTIDNVYVHNCSVTHSVGLWYCVPGGV